MGRQDRRTTDIKKNGRQKSKWKGKEGGILTQAPELARLEVNLYVIWPGYTHRGYSTDKPGLG